MLSSFLQVSGRRGFSLFGSAARRSFSSGSSDNTVVIASAARTPVGSFQSVLASLKAAELGAIAIRAAVQRAGIASNDVNEVIMGNVVSAGIGQAPARQAAIRAGLPESVVCTTINKVCSSGMKAIMLGAQSILLGHHDIVVAGGMESMSNIPYYLPASARSGLNFGNTQLIDGMIHDGLWDPYNNCHMGNAAEQCAKTFNFSREQQDEYAIESYKRAANAHKNGAFKDEIVPVEIKNKKGEVTVITDDEEYHKIDFSKVSKLRPAFLKDGTVTAANSSTLNDGASAVVLMSESRARSLGIKPLARIRGFADAERAPLEFTIAPSLAAPIAHKRAGITSSEVDFWEINEAFSVVSLANMQLLDIPFSKLNVNGGAVALGHPIGSSGSRIVISLAYHLQQTNAKIGCAAICNGGGGASSIVIERA